jgi:hypothetical protein
MVKIQFFIFMIFQKAYSPERSIYEVAVLVERHFAHYRLHWPDTPAVMAAASSGGTHQFVVLRRAADGPVLGLLLYQRSLGERDAFVVCALHAIEDPAASRPVCDVDTALLMHAFYRARRLRARHVACSASDTAHPRLVELLERWHFVAAEWIAAERPRLSPARPHHADYGQPAGDPLERIFDMTSDDRVEREEPPDDCTEFWVTDATPALRVYERAIPSVYRARLESEFVADVASGRRRGLLVRSSSWRHGDVVLMESTAAGMCHMAVPVGRARSWHAFNVDPAVFVPGVATRDELLRIHLGRVSGPRDRSEPCNVLLLDTMATRPVPASALPDNPEASPSKRAEPPSKRRRR